MINQNNFSVRLSKVHNQVEKVMAMHQAEMDKSAQLQKDNSGLMQKLEDNKRLIQSLEEKNKTIKLAQSLSDSGEGSHEIKLKINEYVREIDKCISFLNK